MRRPLTALGRSAIKKLNNSSSVFEFVIQNVSAGKFNILGNGSNGHCKRKFSYAYVSNSESLP